jgi:hypothetical protein
MQAACTDQEHKIIIDESTAMEAVYRIPIKFYKSIKVKGKNDEIPIYIPLLLDHPLQK